MSNMSETVFDKLVQALDEVIDSMNNTIADDQLGVDNTANDSIAKLKEAKESLLRAKQREQNK